MKSIVLASKSPRRKELLTQIGVPFLCCPAVGEEVISTSVPETAVKELALQKAREVRQQYPDSVIVSADTVVAFDGRILGKPADLEDAIRTLKLLQGNVHSVFTGVTIINGEDEITFAEETRVHVFPMTEEEITAYAASGEPMDKAGSYGIQGRFAAYIERIEGDYNNVVGLPVGRLWQFLKKILDIPKEE